MLRSLAAISFLLFARSLDRLWCRYQLLAHSESYVQHAVESQLKVGTGSKCCLFSQWTLLHSLCLGSFHAVQICRYLQQKLLAQKFPVFVGPSPWPKPVRSPCAMLFGSSRFRVFGCDLVLVCWLLRRPRASRRRSCRRRRPSTRTCPFSSCCRRRASRSATGPRSPARRAGSRS